MEKTTAVPSWLAKCKTAAAMDIPSPRPFFRRMKKNRSGVQRARRDQNTDRAGLLTYASTAPHAFSELTAPMAGFRLCGTFALTAAAPFGIFTRIHYSLCHPYADGRALDRIQLSMTLYAGAADLSMGISEEDVKRYIMRCAYKTQKGIDIGGQDVVR